jgi:hypothetical protein
MPRENPWKRVVYGATVVQLPLGNLNFPQHRPSPE